MHEPAIGIVPATPEPEEQVWTFGGCHGRSARLKLTTMIISVVRLMTTAVPIMRPFYITYLTSPHLTSPAWLPSLPFSTIFLGGIDFHYCYTLSATRAALSNDGGSIEAPGRGRAHWHSRWRTSTRCWRS